PSRSQRFLRGERSHTRSSNARATANGAHAKNAVTSRMTVPTRFQRMPPCAPTRRTCSVKNDQLIAGSPRRAMAKTSPPRTASAANAHAAAIATKMTSQTLRIAPPPQCAEQRYGASHDEQQEAKAHDGPPMQRIAVTDIGFAA